MSHNSNQVPDIVTSIMPNPHPDATATAAAAHPDATATATAAYPASPAAASENLVYVTPEQARNIVLARQELPQRIRAPRQWQMGHENDDINYDDIVRALDFGGITITDDVLP